MSGKIILIIDDATALRFILSFDLRRKGYQCLGAPNAQKGIEEAKTKKPDLILLDIMMGRGMDGFDVLKELKSSEETKHIPVIMATARSDKEDILKASQLGAFTFLVKPFGFNELLSKIEKALGAG